MKVSSFSAWVPLIAWLYTKRRIRRLTLRVSIPLLNWVGGYFLLSALSDAMMFTLAEFKMYNHWVAHLYQLFSFYILLVIYYYLLPRIKVQWFYAIGVGFAVFRIFAYYLSHPALTPTAVVRNVLISVFSLLLYRLPKDNYPLTRRLEFWVNYAFSLYFFSSLLIYSNFDEIWMDRSYAPVWAIHALLNIAKGLLVTVGLLRIPPLMRPS